MKKKILALLLMTALAVSVTACGDTSSNDRDFDDVEMDEDEEDDDEVVEADEEQDVDAEADEKDEVVEDEVAKSEGTLVFDAPANMVFEEENNQYVSTEEGVLANINYITNPNDGSFDTTTKEMMEEALEPSLSSVYGETIDLDITRWDYIEVDGYDAVVYEFEYMFSGMKVIQAQVIVDGTEKLHFVTFTYLEQEDFADEVAACIDSFRFE